MSKYKSPENDDVIKKSFEIFWSEAKKKNKNYLEFHSLLIKGNSTPHKHKQLLN